MGYTPEHPEAMLRMGHANASVADAGFLPSKPDWQQESRRTLPVQLQICGAATRSKPSKHRIIKAETLHVNAE